MSAYIDRERLLKRIDKVIQHGAKDKNGIHPISLESVRYYVANMPTVDMPNTYEWISVKDKLPERGTVGRYLVYVENTANYHRLPDNTIIATWFMSDWDFAEWEYNSVTHWMPLPQKSESETGAYKSI